MVVGAVWQHLLTAYMAAQWSSLDQGGSGAAPVQFWCGTCSSCTPCTHTVCPCALHAPAPSLACVQQAGADEPPQQPEDEDMGGEEEDEEGPVNDDVDDRYEDRNHTAPQVSRSAEDQRAGRQAQDVHLPCATANVYTVCLNRIDGGNARHMRSTYTWM